MVRLVTIVVVRVALGAEDATSVPMLCVSEAGLGAGFVVMSTGAVPARSSVRCGDNSVAEAGCKVDVRCTLLSVVAV